MARKSFSVDARALLTLGRDSIKDHATAVVELVKNGYDADAKIIEVELLSSEGVLRIADDGDGMSERIVEKNWLRIGFSEKRDQPTTKRLSRRKTGEKGIGRLSADRLGSKLELRSKAFDEMPVGLGIDWSLFDVPGRDISSIELQSLENPAPRLPNDASTGTELLISNLRQLWTPEDVSKLHVELGLLLPPYLESSKSLQIKFKNDVVGELNGLVEREFIENAEIEFDGTICNDGKLSYSIRYRLNGSNEFKTTPGLVESEQLLTSLQGVIEANQRKQKLTDDQLELDKLEFSRWMVGPVRIRLSFFPRRADLLEKSGLSLSELRSFLDKNSGVRIYRDEIRVKPYGDPDSPEADWLSLNERKVRNPAGAGRASFAIGSSQIVGAIFISRDDNPKLIDSSSREGLIDGYEFKQLRAAAVYCLTIIEARYHTSHVESQGDVTSKAVLAKAAVKDLRYELSTLKNELVELKSIPSSVSGRSVTAPMEQIEVVLNKIADAERQIEEIASQNTVFRGLASVGIASAVFGHETEISAASAQGSITLAKMRLDSGDFDVAELMSDLLSAETAVQQIASWGSFALLRVKKDKRQRKKVSIDKIIRDVLQELKKPLMVVDIDLKSDLEEISARTFSMDIEAVVINFLTNAYHAVKSISKNRTIQIILRSRDKGERHGFEICVSDSGPGFNEAHKDAMWQPLFSTRIDEKGRSAGTGLGLTIVKSAVEELGGSVNASVSTSLGGAEFSAWFPLN